MCAKAGGGWEVLCQVGTHVGVVAFENSAADLSWLPRYEVIGDPPNVVVPVSISRWPPIRILRSVPTL